MIFTDAPAFGIAGSVVTCAIPFNPNRKQKLKKYRILKDMVMKNGVE
jgi:hypothetical protein